MKALEKVLKTLEPKFQKGGPLEKFYPAYEAMDTFLLTPGTPAAAAPHVRDSLDIKRLMSFVIISLIPCIFMGFYNTGFQSLAVRGLSTDFWSCMRVGLEHVLPIIITSYAVGGFWEMLFAVVRRHEINEGFLVTGILFPLTLPPDIPLWIVALGITFGVVIGKEIFGGTGYNILNPALTARAFVFFAYPGMISGDKVWTADGVSGATALLTAATHQGPGVVESIQAAGTSFSQAFTGIMPGSIGETSALACLLGAAFLIVTGVGSWRIMISMVLGGICMALLMNAAAGPSSAGMMSLPPHWHLVLGGFAFGTVFMATDPVSAACTDQGKWIYGFLTGALAILIRSVNPAYPEGVMLAILFMNVFAPLIDHFTVEGRLKRRNALRQARGTVSPVKSREASHAQ